MENVLEIKDLEVRYETDDGIVRAVNGVSFSVGKEKTLGSVAVPLCWKVEMFLQ